MKLMPVLVVSILASAAFSAGAAQVPTGVWKQSSSTSGDCADCEITVTKTTPQIILIASNNGWKGYAYYSSKEDRYMGALQWEDGAYNNAVLIAKVTYDGKTLSLDAQSTPISFSSTYRKK